MEDKAGKEIMGKSIILPNKWGIDARLEICEKIVKTFSALSNALGFKIIMIEVAPGHIEAGIKDRKKFDLPTVITEAQCMRKACDELLEKLGCGAEIKETNKQKVVVLCGSSKFVDIMAVCAWFIERDEKAITMGLHLLPHWYSKEPIPDHLAEFEGVQKEMDALHKRKIDLADEIFVVNSKDYIGESTKSEIEYAQAKGIPIRWYTHDEIGIKVDRMLVAFIGQCDSSDI